MGDNAARPQDQLSTYVRDYMAAHDMSERQLALKAVDPVSGQRVLHTWLNSLLLGTMVRAPELWRLRALAVAMGVPEKRLAELAAAQWLGVQVAHVETSSGQQVTITVPKGLTGEARARFILMAEDIARRLAE